MDMPNPSAQRTMDPWESLIKKLGASVNFKLPQRQVAPAKPQAPGRPSKDPRNGAVYQWGRGIPKNKNHRG